MSDQEKILAVIPARGGSKRLPGKNIIDLNGKPLIAHTIEAVIRSNCFSGIIVSTDYENVAEVARRYPEVEVDQRDPELATDTTRVIDVILELCNRHDVHDQYQKIAMFLPTAPFRKISDIQAGYNLLDRDVDTVISVCEYEFPPQMAVALPENGFISPIFPDSPLITGNTRSQDQVPAYRPNGSFYMSWIERLLINRSFFKGRVKGLIMSRLSSADIDDMTDLTMAKLMITAGVAQSDVL